MTRKRIIYRWCIALLLCLVQTAGIAVYGQDQPRAANKRQQRQPTNTEQRQALDTLRRELHIAPDTLSIKEGKPLQISPATEDSLAAINATADSIAAENKKRLLEMTASPTTDIAPMPTDSLNGNIGEKTFVPNPTKATWLALVIPGGGQIYNRKYWKLPIIYGGFAGCTYALTWNGKMYKDYMRAYKDAARGNINATSVTDLLPPGYIDRVPESQLVETLRKRKDTYRRYRDMSIFAFIGVYLISVVDAYVDAELSNFDITPDLSMHIEPTLINNQYSTTAGSNRSVGVQCSFRF